MVEIVKDAHEDFRALIQEVSAAISPAWHSFDSYRSKKERQIIIVDLTVDHWCALITRLLLAKYASWYFDADLHGMAIAPNAVPAGMQDICNAFGCPITFYAEDLFSLQVSKISDINGEIRPLIQGWPMQGDALRSRVEGLTIDGIPVGDLIYDSYLRANGCPTVEGLNNSLLSSVADGFVRFHMYNGLLDRHEVAAVVVAHTVYNYIGMLARTAASRSVPVLYDDGVVPLYVKRRCGFAEARMPQGYFSFAEFESVFRHEREEATAFGRSFMESRVGGAVGLVFDDTASGAYAKQRRLADRTEICRELGWSEGKPIVTVMTHVMVESPHAVPGTLHPDVHAWMRHTLDVAARNPHIQWLIKGHPDEQRWEVGRGGPLAVPDRVALERLLEPHREAAHIRLCPTDLHTRSVMDCSQAVVTRFGSCGFEFASQGIPVVIAAQASYARHGFTIEPRTHAEYEEALARLDRVEPLSEEQRARALTYIYLLMGKSRGRTTLLADQRTPEIPTPEQDARLLRTILERAGSFDPGTDPFHEAVKRMLQLGTTSLNMRLW